MRRLGTWAVVLSLAACGSALAAQIAPSAPGAAGAHCGPPSATTLATSSVARVYALGSSVYGCSIHGSTIYALGHRGFCFGTGCVQSPVVAGERAGYGLERCGIDTCFAQVRLERLTDGALLRSEAATTRPLGAESFQSVGSLVLKPDGALAWIGLGTSIGVHVKDIEVHRADRLGLALLDSGAAIRPGSLQLHGSRATWKHGPSTRSATLH